MSHKDKSHGPARLAELRKQAREARRALMRHPLSKQIAKDQIAENPIGSADVPSYETSAKLAAYLRMQAVAFVGREHPARNALFALSIVAACCDSGVDLRSMREAVRIADACLRRFGV